jgi:hypothetical protein
MNPAREVKTERFSRTEGKTPAFERCRLAGSSCKLAPPAEHRWGVYSPGNDLVSQFPINRMALEIFAGPHDPTLHMPGRSLVAVSRR